MEFALSIFLHDPDFVLREVVEVINEAVDLLGSRRNAYMRSLSLRAGKTAQRQIHRLAASQVQKITWGNDATPSTSIYAA